MKKVAILPNIQKDKGLAVTKRLVRYLAVSYTHLTLPTNSRV